MRNVVRSFVQTSLPSPDVRAIPSAPRLLFLIPLIFFFAGALASPAFGQSSVACAPDVNFDDAVDADDALVLYYAYSLKPVLGTGRGGNGATEDTAPVDPEVSIAAGAPLVPEGSPAVFVLSVSEARQSTFAVEVTVEVEGDFEVDTSPRRVEFEVCDRRVGLSIETRNDDVFEATGTVTATVVDGVGYEVGASSTASVAIADDDVAISIAASSSPVVEGEPAWFVLSASEEPLTAFTVEVAIDAAGGDFEVATGTRLVTFGVGQRTAAVRVDSEGDELDEADGMVTATVRGGFGYTVGDPAMDSVTISDDDVTISIVASSSLVVEGSAAWFVLVASEAPLTAFAVQVALEEMGDFGVDTDPRTIPFEVGEVRVAFSVGTRGDEAPEPSGTVTAMLEDGAGYAVGASSTAEVTVLDDDGGGFRECADCPEMVVVPGGVFTMGSPADEDGRQRDEGPQHEVRIARFAVGRHEVTFAEWDACHDAGGCSHAEDAFNWGRGTRPVIFVSWNDAQKYVTWLSRETGETYRLLTESEWEYAARASSTTAYHWGDAIGNLNANCWDCGATDWDNKQTAPVGSFPANAFGLHDMLGNVWEWVEDCQHRDYTSAPTNGRAWQDENGGDCNERVERGGSWDSRPEAVRSADRLYDSPDFRFHNRGFRVARTLPGGAVVYDDVTISIAASSSPVVEGSPAFFVLAASEAAEVALTVNVALSGVDRYRGATGTPTVVFERGDTLATLRVETQGDGVPEAAGTVTAALQPGLGYVAGAAFMASVTVVDDDGGGFRECAACPEMVLVPGGMFTMGSPDDEDGREADESPRHEVSIARFAVGRYEVTFAEWDACHAAHIAGAGAEGCSHDAAGDEGWGRGTRPVIDVSRSDAREYVAWLSRETGATYRLLTESEWEYAARAGTTTAYHWGDDVQGDNSGRANCVGCGGDWDYPDEREDERKSAPVGSYPANAFGLHDMLGNVWEWVEDCWHESYGDEDGNVIAPLNGAAWGGEDGGNCGLPMIRGGSWSRPPTDIRSATRAWRTPNVGTRYNDNGFRVARELD